MPTWPQPLPARPLPTLNTHSSRSPAETRPAAQSQPQTPGEPGEPRAEPNWLCFNFLPIPAPPHGVVFDCGLVLLYLSFNDPTHCPMCREPCSCLVYLGVPPGFGEPALPRPPTLEFVCIPFIGSGGLKGLQEVEPPHTLLPNAAPPPMEREANTPNPRMTKLEFGALV